MKEKILSLALAAGMSAMLLPTVACAASQSYTEQNATLIAFSDDAVTASGAYSGYEIDGTAVSITEAGTYEMCIRDSSYTSSSTKPTDRVVASSTTW